MTISEAMETAVHAHQAGRLREAEQLYRQVLHAMPDHFDAMQLLGLVLYQSGRFTDALALLERAVTREPRAWGPRCNLALTLMELGRMRDAARAAEAALAINPDAVDGLFCRAAVLFESGRCEEAVPVWQRVVELQPAYAAAWASLGATYEKLGRLDEALAACERAVQLDPAVAESHSNLGSVLEKLGRLNEAIESHRRAISLDPNHVPALLNLSSAGHHEVRYDEAAAAARRAIELHPNNPLAHRNLAATLHETGLDADAERAFNTAAELLRRRGEPGDENLANHIRLTAATLLPLVYDSMDELTQARRRVVTAIEDLKRDNLTIDVHDEQPPTVFALAYHGENDRDVMRSVAEFFAAPPLPEVAAGGARPRSSSRIRVGFISRFLRNHTIGRLNLGLISKLSRERFEVVTLKMIGSNDAVAEQVRAASDQYVTLPPVLPRARQMILEQSLDVLFYCDIGMDPLTYALAFSRLAPVQCSTWGHPVTSGIGTIDYFISADAMEPPGSEDQYTERLVRLPAPAVYYERPTLPANAKTRADFGLPDGAVVYGCLQMIFKFHPEFDEILAGILQRDPRAIVLLLRGVSNVWTDKLIARLRRTLGDVAFARVHFTPMLPYSDFLTLTSLCDVVIDPVHFGGGNTSYEAFAFGVPVITWPSGMARGRIAYALYKLMGIDDCIAGSREEYAELAVSIAADPARRRAVSEKILVAHSALFENLEGVKALEAFFIRATGASAS